MSFSNSQQFPTCVAKQVHLGAREKESVFHVKGQSQKLKLKADNLVINYLSTFKGQKLSP